MEQTPEKILIRGGVLTAPIHLRKAASTSSALLDDIPQGSEAELLEGGEAWSRIRWKGKTGYVKSEFTQPAGEADSGSAAAVSGSAGAIFKSSGSDASAPLSAASAVSAVSVVSAAESAESPEPEWIFVPRDDLEKAYDLLGNLLGLRG